MKNKFLFFYILFSIISYSQSIKNDSLKIELILKKAKQEQDNLKYSETYQSLIEALQLAEKTNQNALEFKTQIAIANLHVMKGEYQLAKKKFENYIPDNSTPKYIQSYYFHRKAFYLNETLQLDSALVVAQKGLLLAKQENYTNDIITIYNEIGYILQKQKKYSEAINYFDKVIQLSQNDLSIFSSAMAKKGKIYSDSKQYKESNKLITEVLKLIDTTNWHREKNYYYDILANNYKNLGDSINFYKNSFYRNEEQLKADNATSENQYNDLLIKYQTKEKDELIATKENERKRFLYLIFGISGLLILAIPFSIYTKNQNQKLKKTLDNNQFLLKELNHRSKNNLQLVVSLATREMNKTNSNEITGLTNLTSKIESIAALNKQLYLNEQMESIELKNYIEEIFKNLQPFILQNNITVKKEIDKAEINANQSLYIGLIVNELVVNAIKHAFPNQENKRINITIKKANSTLEIEYNDNGIGTNENKKVKLLSTLSRQIEAEYNIENKNGFYYFAKIKM